MSDRRGGWAAEMARLEQDIQWAGDDPERLSPLYAEKRRLLALGQPSSAPADKQVGMKPKAE